MATYPTSVTMTMTLTEAIFVRAALEMAQKKAQELWSFERDRWGDEDLGSEVLETYEEAIAVVSGALMRTREG